MRTWHLVAAVAAALLAILGLSIALIWWRDWWPSGQGDQWDAVAAIGTAMTALVALGGLAAVLFARAQLQALRRQTRIELAPYLRVDLSLDVPGGQWQPPEVDAHYRLTDVDLDPPAQPGDLFEQWHSDDEVAVLLWITNQQTQPSGVARWVAVDVELELPQVSADSTTGIVAGSVSLHYIEPGRTVCYTIGHVARDVPYLAGRVVRLAYSGITSDALSLGHGSTAFEWDGRRLQNRRSILFGSEDRQYGN